MLPPETKTHVTIGLFGLFSDPEEITAHLAISPSHCFGNREKYIGHIDRDTLGPCYRPIGHWSWCTFPTVDSTDPCEHVREAVELFEPRRRAIEGLRSDRQIAVKCWVHYAMSAYDPGYTISGDLMARLGALCDDISFTHHVLDIAPDDVDSE